MNTLDGRPCGVPFSRLMLMLPSRMEMSATCSNGTCEPSGVSTSMFAAWRSESRRCSGRRTTTAKCFLTFPHLCGRLAAEGGFDRVLDVGDVEAVARGALAVDFDLHLWHWPTRSMAAQVTPRTSGDLAKHFLGVFVQHRDVVAEDLDDDLAVDLRDALQHVVADRLREADDRAGIARRTWSISSVICCLGRCWSATAVLGLEVRRRSRPC